MGLKRLALLVLAASSAEPSPPIVSMRSSSAPQAPITWSYISQLFTPSASRAKKASCGLGVLKCVRSSKPSSTMAITYVISLPVASETVMVFCCSGLIASGIRITGFSTVFLSCTIMGITPYIRIGRSLMVCSWGCIRLMLTYTLGDMSFVTVNEYLVCPCVVFIQYVFNTLLPVSILIKALPSLAVGIVSFTSSPTL